MSAEVLKSILTWVGGVLTAGGVPLLIYLLSRKDTLRKSRSETDLNQSQVYDRIIERLQQDNDGHREQVKELRSQVRELETKAEETQRQFTEQLQIANTERQRLLTRIAQLESDLAIANRQLADLRRPATGGFS